MGTIFVCLSPTYVRGLLFFAAATCKLCVRVASGANPGHAWPSLPSLAGPAVSRQACGGVIRWPVMRRNVLTSNCAKYQVTLPSYSTVRLPCGEEWNGKFFGGSSMQPHIIACSNRFLAQHWSPRNRNDARVPEHILAGGYPHKAWHEA